MAKTVKKSAKPVAKKATPKKSTAKPVAKKVAPKKAAAKPVAKKSAPKPAPKKVVSKPSPKKAVAKLAPKKAATKPAAKKAVAKAAPKKAVAKPATKAAPKKTATKKAAFNPKGGKLTSIGLKDISKKAIDKLGKKAAVKATPKKATVKPVAKKAVAKKTVAKPIAKKAATKPVAKKIVAKKVEVKPAVKKAVAKPVAKKSVSKPKSTKPAAIIKEDKTAKMAERRKKIQEIKNNYETPKDNHDEDYGDYKLPIIGRTRFSDAELNEFKTVINKKLAEAREELNFYQDQMKESEMNDDDIKFSGMEDGGHTNDKEHLSAMANRQIKFIQGLDAALIRIANKTYGICRMTGNLIDKKRLMAVPHATLSMEAKVGNKKR
jgi:RNA polymerase-binding transcription factor DksA